MARIVRAKETVVVRHPEHGMFVAVQPGQEYDPDDPIVKAHPWLFESDAERVERATAAPGERRRR